MAVVHTGFSTLSLAFSPPFTPRDADGAAKFLSHVPYDETYDPDELDPDMPDFDADVKIPGRHYPKLPYGHPFHAQSAGAASHHARSYQPGHAGGSQQGYGQTGHWLGQGYYPDQRPASPRHDQGFQSDHGDDQDYYQTNQLYDQTHRNGGARQGAGEEDSQVSATQLPTGPHFDRSLPRSITVQAGKTARLVCRVFDIGETSVSWIRVGDLHILSVGKYKYSTDSRLSVIFNEPEQEWVLQIAGVTESDAGMYECQISTKPVLSFMVSMEVVAEAFTTTPFPKLSDVEETQVKQSQTEQSVPSATIVNGPEIFVHRGSLINLTCIVDHTTERPLYIVWYHYNKLSGCCVVAGIQRAGQQSSPSVYHCPATAVTE
ncbi:hypothetical protein C7M84_010351 [Penaeus vannamei]|uniref:Ig-like domain-containing protein n=1 Tax=Penaeus vannamei TaxID=6689 RepID=A0A423T484_PENVA|nr:hypothetical protein C7M84_010351 [Penaeus vannamei]